jgi:hypothetical protein
MVLRQKFLKKLIQTNGLFPFKLSAILYLMAKKKGVYGKIPIGYKKYCIFKVNFRRKNEIIFKSDNVFFGNVNNKFIL